MLEINSLYKNEYGDLFYDVMPCTRRGIIALAPHKEELKKGSFLIKTDEDFDDTKYITSPSSKAFTITLSVKGWSEGKTQRIENSSFELEKQGWSYIVTPYLAEEDLDAIAEAGFVKIKDGGIEAGAAIFTCGKTPTAPIRMNIFKFKSEESAKDKGFKLASSELIKSDNAINYVPAILIHDVPSDWTIAQAYVRGHFNLYGLIFEDDESLTEEDFECFKSRGIFVSDPEKHPLDKQSLKKRNEELKRFFDIPEAKPSSQYSKPKKKVYRKQKPIKKTAAGSIQVEWDGLRFRSRAEAQYAVEFKAWKRDFIYEFEGFNLPNGKRYLPDYYMDKVRIQRSSSFEYLDELVLEVKGKPTLSDYEFEKLTGFMDLEEYPLLVLGAVPKGNNLDEVFDLLERRHSDHPHLFDLWELDESSSLVYPGISKNGEFTLYTDRNSSDMDRKQTWLGYKSALQARWEWGEEPQIFTKYA